MSARRTQSPEVTGRKSRDLAQPLDKGFVMEKETSTSLPDLPVQDSPNPDEPEPVARRLESDDESDPPATRKELYSYYAYYAGNNGIGSFQ